MGAAGIIGTSWIYTNGEFFAAYGAGGEIFGLAFATVLVSFVAMAYAELASKLPRAGGEIVYGYVAFNRTVSFVGGWLLIGAYISSLAFYVTASGTLLAQLFPSLESIPLYTIAGTEVYLPMLLVGMAMAVLVCVVNCYGTGLGAGTQLVFFCLMLAIGAVLVVVGFASGSPGNFWPPYEPGSDAVFSTLRFVLPALTFLTGFALVAILAEDADVRPANIGRVVVAVVVIAGTFYCVVLLASAWIIPWTKTATLDQGTIDTYRVAGFPALGWGAYTISVLGLVTSFLALFVAASRIMVGLARAGLFPRLRQSQRTSRHPGQRIALYAGPLPRPRVAGGGRAHLVSRHRGRVRGASLVYRDREHVLDKAPLPAPREPLPRARFVPAGDRGRGGRARHPAYAGARHRHISRVAVGVRNPARVGRTRRAYLRDRSQGRGRASPKGTARRPVREDRSRTW